VDASDFTEYRPLMFSIADRMTGSVSDAEDIVQEASDSLSMAFLVLLESLSPAERAVFLLREVFGYGYQEIADITGKSESACRQTFASARRRVDEGKPRFETSRAEGEALTDLWQRDVTSGSRDD
jgi:DNA-directed RNA polymerase specialized sigma24 family protein